MNNKDNNYSHLAHGRLAYKVSEAADLIGVHHSTIRNLVARGELESVGNLRHLLISRESLLNLLNSKREAK
jgi:excisionase family DNA binding protein